MRIFNTLKCCHTLKINCFLTDATKQARFTEGHAVIDMSIPHLNFSFEIACWPKNLRRSNTIQVELANRFTRTVAVRNLKEMMMGEKEHQEIVESCNRLIKNNIIFWNYLYLELRLKKSNVIDQEKIRTVIKAHSPVSWAHVNFLGEYDFSDEKVKDSWEILPTKK